MKIKKLNILLVIFSLSTILGLIGCKKDDGAIRSSVKIADVPVISTSVDPGGSQAIDMLNLGAFAGKFTVAPYFTGTAAPTKVDIVIRKNGSNSNVKVYKAGVTTFPSSYTFLAADLATIFGTAVMLGDTYDFAPDIYVGERKFEAFPTVGAGTAAGVIGMPLFSEFARFAAICAYDPAIYQGTFNVVSDAFGEFQAGEAVTITKVSNTSFSFIYPYASNPVPVIVNVNPLNNQLTITKQKVGNNFYQYTNLNMAVAASAVSFAAPCDKEIRLAIAYTVDQGQFGTHLLVLKKP